MILSGPPSVPKSMNLYLWCFARGPEGASWAIKSLPLESSRRPALSNRATNLDFMTQVSYFCQVYWSGCDRPGEKNRCAPTLDATRKSLQWHHRDFCVTFAYLDRTYLIFIMLGRC